MYIIQLLDSSLAHGLFPSTRDALRTWRSKRAGERLLARPEEEEVRGLVALAAVDVKHGDGPAVRFHLARERRRRVHLPIDVNHPRQGSPLPGSLTSADVPTTKHMSARSTSASISGIWCGISVNHTTAGRARAPHFVQRASASSGSDLG